MFEPFFEKNSRGTLAFFSRDYVTNANIVVVTTTTTNVLTFEFTAQSSQTHIIVQNNFNGTRDFYVDNVVIEDITAAGYLADVMQSQDYSPFGVVLEGRHFTVGDGYRYGFQGQESDDEIKGEGNSINYKYRMHDPRIGRFFAIDPLAVEFPWNSPYAFSENKVINCIELEGAESLDAVGANGQPIFKQKAILMLPDATTVIIWNAQQGGRYVISREDMQRINSFSAEGYSAQPQIHAPQTTGIGEGTTQVQGMVYIDGATKPSDFPYNQFESTTIQAPSQITLTLDVVTQGSFDGKGEAVVLGPHGPVPINSSDQVRGSGKWQAQQINRDAMAIMQNSPLGAVRKITGVTVEINAKSSPEEQKEVMDGIISSSKYPVSFIIVEMESSVNLTGRVTLNYEDTTQQQQQVQTLQIISQP